MPKYVYQGLTTGVTFELEQRITEAALTHHPETNEPVKRLIGRPAISFKGSGFYANDSKSGSSSEPKVAPIGDAKPSDATHSDVKPSDVKPSDTRPSDTRPSEAKAESSSQAASSDKSTAPTKDTSSPAPAAKPAAAKSAD